MRKKMLNMPLVLTLLAIEALVILAVIVVGVTVIRRQGSINQQLADDHAMLTAAVLGSTDECLASEYVALIAAEQKAS